MAKVVVLASVNMDIVLRVDKAPVPGETIMGHTVAYVPGGKGLNQALAAKRMGIDTELVGKVGNDAFGTDLSKFIRSQKFKKATVSKSKKPTGVAMIMVANDGENSIGVSRGANEELSALDVLKVSIGKNDVVMSTLEISQQATLALFKKAKQKKAVTILNASAAAPLVAGLNRLVDIFCVNETELSFYAKKPIDPADINTVEKTALSLITSKDQCVLVTLGKHGIVCACRAFTFFDPSYKVKVVDTTGAGDCFVGVFAAMLAKGESITKAIEFANAAAALKVQTFGASSSPKKAEVLKFFKHHAGK